ncbi:MAG: efflux RND transporter permease subunit [Candidatus Paceibacterota bacterium]|jgi:multidrug efflux pump subunit AcrB
MLWLWNFFLDKRQFSYVLIATLVIAGSYALFEIPKENAPAIVIPNGVVVTTLPGASAKDMELLVTKKIEDQVSGLSNVDTMTSSSRDGVSQVVVQFAANADLNQSIQDLRDAAAKAVPNLPTDASTPTVSKISISDRPIIVISLASSLPPTEFSALAKAVSDEIKSVSGVSTVEIAGIPPREVDVIVKKEMLAQYGLNITDVTRALRNANAALPAGKISMQGVNYDVNFKGGITDSSEIADIAVGTKGGAPIYLRDVALVSDSLAPASTYSRLSLGGKPSGQAVALTVSKQAGASIQEVANAVREKVAQLQKTSLADTAVYISPSTDQGVQVGKQLRELAQTGLETVLLVVLVLLLTIGWRESFVAALSIPLSFLIAFIGLYATGNTLNFISLFALILAVGILVDTGIVVTEAIHARIKIHNDPLVAARVALRDYAWPLIAGTMATVAVFIPLFFISGIVGKYIAGIPYTLIFVLLASIVVALGFVPLIAILLTGEKKENRFEVLQEEYTMRVTLWYRRFLRRLLENARAQKLFLRGLGIAFIVVLALPVAGVIPAVFLPQDDVDFIYINIEKQQGTTLAQTDLAAREVEEVLYAYPGIESFQTTVGQSSNLLGNGSSGGSYANITVNLPLGHAKSSTQVLQELQERLAVVQDATVQVLQPSNGPPGGAPIQVQFRGANGDDLMRAADAGAQLLATIPHVTNITSSTKNNGIEFNLTIDRAKAAAVLLDTATIAQTLRTAVQGVKATSITTSGDTIDIVVKLNLNSAYTDPSNTNEATLDSIKNISIQSPSGPVLLGSLLSENLGQSSASISHKNKLRIETVSAYPGSETTTSAVIAAFQKRIAELHLASGVIVSYGGESEDISKSFKEMFIALIAGLVLMFMILIVSFNSFRYTGYLLVIVPLSLIGVLGGLALTGQPLSFSSVLGIIALAGVIINHAIILMDSMIHHLAASSGKPIIDVVIEAAATRLRPIVLTTITTVVGMIPLSMVNAMWGPLAFAIMFGLTFAIVLTLALVPMLFYRAVQRDRRA